MTNQFLTAFPRESIYELLFESAAEGLAVINQSGKIIMANSRLREMFGYDPGELVGEKIEVLIPQSHRSKHLSHRKAYHAKPVKRSMGQGMDLWGEKKDGQQFPVEISLNYFGEGAEQLVMALVTDITERKQSEAKLKQLNEGLEERIKARTKELDNAIRALEFSNEELQQEIQIRRKAEQQARQSLIKEKQLNELKSRFVSLASHEFRTPLSTVLTSVTLISKYIEHNDKSLKHINRIKSAVHNLTGILNDFLSLDKLEDGKVQNNPVEFDLRTLAEDIIEEMQTVAKSGQVIRHEHSGKGDPVWLDKQLLKNIIINLLSNAIKYSKEDQVIRFTTDLADDLLTIAVRDEGIGIPESEQSQLFERFFRAKNAVNIQGTGLGLNIVKRYVDLIGGNISFNSKLQEGTTFTVTIPINTNQS